MVCEELLTAGYSHACDGQRRGFEADGVIINRADIDFSTSTLKTGTNKGTIVLKSGAKGYAIVQPANNPFDGSASELNVGTYVNTWTKNIQVLLMSVGPDTSALVDKLVNANCVLILRNKQKYDSGSSTPDDESEYEVFGIENGLKVSAGSRTPNDEDTMGGTLLTLTESNAPSHGMFMWDTDKATTDAAYTALV